VGWIERTFGDPRLLRVPKIEGEGDAADLARACRRFLEAYLEAQDPTHHTGLMDPTASILARWGMEEAAREIGEVLVRSDPTCSRLAEVESAALRLFAATSRNPGSPGWVAVRERSLDRLREALGHLTEGEKRDG
jgi:hypothetical protein